MLNKIGRDIPMELECLQGRRVYEGQFAMTEAGTRAGKPVKLHTPGENKLLGSIDEAIEKVGLKDGMSISFIIYVMVTM